jgi:hypothetical protein
MNNNDDNELNNELNEKIFFEQMDHDFVWTSDEKKRIISQYYVFKNKYCELHGIYKIDIETIISLLLFLNETYSSFTYQPILYDVNADFYLDLIINHYDKKMIIDDHDVKQYFLITETFSSLGWYQLVYVIY